MKASLSLEQHLLGYVKKAWKRRWIILIFSILYLSFFMTMFIAGIIIENPFPVSVGGLAISFYVWLAGLAICSTNDSRKRDHQLPKNENSTSGQTSPTPIPKRQLVHYYMLIITLSYTFWLGMFPNGKVWVATFVILSGMLVMILLSHILHKPIDKPLKAIKFLTFCYVILAIKLALGVGLFPNFTEFMRTKFIPKLGENINSMMMGWVTPKKEESKPPMVISSVVNTPPPKDPPTPPKGDTGGTGASGNNGDTGSSDNGKKRRNLKPYLDERRAKLRVDFPDLFPDSIKTPTAVTPTTGEIIAPLSLPPVKQLP